MPSCPLCGRNDSVTRVVSPTGDFFCGCGTVFDGTDDEWRRWAARRRERIERAAGTRKPLPAQTSHHSPIRKEGDSE